MKNEILANLAHLPEEAGDGWDIERSLPDGQGCQTGLQASHHPVVARGHHGHPPRPLRGLVRLGLRRHGLTQRPPGRHRGRLGPPAPGPGGRVLYDRSSSWVEGSHCPLAKRGHSRDAKMGKGPGRVRPHLLPRGPAGCRRGLRRQHRRPQSLHLRSRGRARTLRAGRRGDGGRPGDGNHRAHRGAQRRWAGSAG